MHRRVCWHMHRHTAGQLHKESATGAAGGGSANRSSSPGSAILAKECLRVSEGPLEQERMHGANM